MIINNDPEYEKKKAFEEKLARSEDQQKEDMLAELRKESTAVICLATLYAKGYENYGIDITKAWETTEQQAAILQRIYREGYHRGLLEGIGQGKKIAQEEAMQVNPMSGDDEFWEGPKITKDILINEGRIQSS